MKIVKIEKVGKIPVYDISVKDAEHYVLENGVVTHNTGGMLSSDNVWMVGRSQEKDGTELVGYNFTINIEKSRYVKEKSKIPIRVTFDGGISKYTGILEMALEAGEVVKPKNARYQLIDKSTGELIGEYVKEAATQTEEFLGVVLKRESFKQWVRDKYKLVQGKMFTEDIEDDFVIPEPQAVKKSKKSVQVDDLPSESIN